MLKFYFISNIIWFIATISIHIIFYKPFKESQKKIKKATNDNTKEWGYFKTTLYFLLISFIPIIRLFELITYLIVVFRSNKMIEIIKEQEKNNGKFSKKNKKE